ANYTFAAGDNGAHTFTNAVTLKTSGSKSVVATDTVTGTITGTTNVTINPAGASTLVVTTTAGSPQTAGVAFSSTVTAKDAFGNVATGYLGTIHFTSTDGQAVVPADYTFVAGDTGAHTFTNAVTLKTAGSQTITATDTVSGTITGTSPSVTVAPAATDHFIVTAGSPQTAGAAFSATVTAKDLYDNTTPAYTGVAHFTSSDGQAVPPANYTFVAGDN